MSKHIYIHFETRPSVQALGDFFEHYPAYRKVFATSYCFDLENDENISAMRALAEKCFKFHSFIICVGKNYRYDESGLFLVNRAVID